MRVTILDQKGAVVPNGTKVAVTTEPVFVADSIKGAIIGGTTSTRDSRFKVFPVIDGALEFLFKPVSTQTGYSYIQVVAVDNNETPTGLLQSRTIQLTP